MSRPASALAAGPAVGSPVPDSAPGGRQAACPPSAGGAVSPDGPALEARGLTVWLHRGGRANRALRGVDLTIGRGEIVALVGESGSGKSTLGFAAQGLLPADSAPVLGGSLVVDGTEVVGADPATLRRLRRTRVGAVFQDPMGSLNPTMRIGEQVAEATPNGTAPGVWLERVGIPDPTAAVRAYPHQLSGGQRQRVMIAIAMAAGPALVVADEPTTALDVTVQARVLQLFRNLRDASGTAFLFVTHDLAVAAEIADRIVVLYGGRVVEHGPVASVVGGPAHPYTLALLEARFGLTVDKSHQLPTLPGSPPAPDAETGGCGFAPRCVLAAQACVAAVPPLVPAPRHPGAAACVRTSDLRPDLWQRAARPWPARVATEAGERPVVEVAGVHKAYPGRARRAAPVVALRGVDLRIADGESVALVGESGSGKSTLLRVVAGLVEPTAGTVTVRSTERPQMVYQDAAASLTPWMQVGEQVGERLRRRRAQGRRLGAGERDALVAEALQRVGLDPELARLRPGQLSGGQRQRVAVARAVVVPPRLLLCDEPVSAMDVSLAAGVLNLLESLRRELGMAMVFVTHDIAAARFAADRIVVMRSGEVVEDGPAEQVVAEPAAEYTRLLLDSMPLARAAS